VLAKEASMASGLVIHPSNIDDCLLKKDLL